MNLKPQSDIVNLYTNTTKYQRCSISNIKFMEVLKMGLQKPNCS